MSGHSPSPSPPSPPAPPEYDAADGAAAFLAMRFPTVSRPKPIPDAVIASADAGADIVELKQRWTKPTLLEISTTPYLAEVAVCIAEAHGYPVFPCNADKEPLTPHGYKDASTDPDKIRRMFAKAGAAAKLIGVPTGAASGVDVLDADPRHGSDEWRQANIHRLSETRIHGTTSGGEHWIFRHQEGVRNSAGKVAAGIDVRGDGGYACWPGSPGYTVISDADIAEWPDWLLPLVLKPEAPAQRPTFTPQRAIGQLEVRLRGFVGSPMSAARPKAPSIAAFSRTPACSEA